jgi:hypothetical protein
MILQKLVLITIMLYPPLQLYAPIMAKTSDTRVSSENQINFHELELQSFLDTLAFHETKDSTYYPWKGFKSPWVVVNNKGAKGRWQIMPIAFADIGYKGTTKQFLNSRELQKECVIKVMKRNKLYIKYYIPDYQKYIGKKRFGVKITFSGMLAASHLAGVGGLKEFLRKGTNATDGNESVRSYLYKFQGYELEEII